MIANNIKYLRHLTKISQKTLAEHLGVPNTVVSNWENEEYKPSTENIIKIADYFKVSVHDLVNIEMNNKYRLPIHNIDKIILKEQEVKLPKEIPLIPTEAMAGYLKGEIQILEYECEKFVIPTFKDADFLIPVKGGSMFPKYNPGDIVACRKLSIDTFFQWNKVYVLDTEQGALIKRVKKGSTPDTVKIVSENKEYEPFELTRDKIYAIAEVIGIIRLE